MLPESLLLLLLFFFSFFVGEEGKGEKDEVFGEFSRYFRIARRGVFFYFLFFFLEYGCRYALLNVRAMWFFFATKNCPDCNACLSKRQRSNNLPNFHENIMQNITIQHDNIINTI